jgi:penicillin G amidase
LVRAARTYNADALPAVQRLARWDYRMSRDAIQVVLFHAWVDALGDRVFAPRIPPQVRAAIGSRWSLTALIDLLQSPDSAFGPDPSRARDWLLIGALADAESSVLAKYGPDTTRWRWGSLHTASFAHPVSTAFDLPAVSRAGDANTVYASGGAGDRQTAGASYREIIDLADWDRSVATSTPGQSGQPGSPHYGDLLPLWGADQYFPLVYSRRAVERHTRHVLTLQPTRAP